MKLSNIKKNLHRLFLSFRKEKEETIRKKFELLAFDGDLEGIKQGLEEFDYFFNKKQTNKFVSNVVRSGHLDCVKFLFDINFNQYISNESLLKITIDSTLKNIDIVQFLIEQKTDIYANNQEALYYAILNSHTDIVKLLLEQGPDPKGTQARIPNRVRRFISYASDTDKEIQNYTNLLLLLKEYNYDIQELAENILVSIAITEKYHLVYSFSKRFNVDLSLLLNNSDIPQHTIEWLKKCYEVEELQQSLDKTLQKNQKKTVLCQKL